MADVDGYRIVRELGRGGAGAVFLAQRPGELPVALKLQLGAFADPRAQKRFRREVEALQALRHPGIVRLRGAGTDQGRSYLVMDYVDGPSLGGRLRAGGPLEPQHAARLVAELARAVQHAHDRGVLHRDLKPDNVLLEDDERPLLSDFGLTRDVDLGASRLTRTGGFVGTPGYWAPEQAFGQRERTGPASDVYGLGAILYACLTGQPPRPTQLDVAAFDLPVVPPERLRRGVPAWISAVCMRCLAHEPGDRYPSAAELARALEAAPAPSRLPRVRLLAGAVVGVALVLVVSSEALQSVAQTPQPAEGPAPAEPVAVHAEVEPDDVQQPPDAGAARLALQDAQALATEGRSEEALSALTRLLGAGSVDPEVWVLSGRLKSNLGRFAEAEEDLARGLELDGNDAGGWVSRVHVLRKLGRPESALAAADRAVELAPDMPNAHYNRGRILHDLGRRDEAVEAYSACVRLDPGDSGAYANRGVTLMQLGRSDEALASHEACLRLDPRNPIALEGRGKARLDQGRPLEALQDLSLALEIDPSASPSTWANHGVALAQLKRFPEARRSLERAVQLGTEEPTIYVNLGLACREVGDTAAARQALEEALRRYPPGSMRETVEGYLAELGQ